MNSVVLSSRTKSMIRSIPDAGLRRVIAEPNEEFGGGWSGCLFAVAFERDAERARAFVRATCLYLPMETEKEREFGFDSCEGYDFPLCRAEIAGLRGAYLNEIKSFAAEVLASRCSRVATTHVGAIAK